MGIGCTHIPYEEPGFLDFCLDVQRENRCGTIVHCGDLVNNGQIGYHEPEPDLKSPKGEMDEARRHLEDWYNAFPNLFLTWGNHDLLPQRKGKTAGLASKHIVPFRKVWDLPNGWKDDFRFVIDGVLYSHGSGYSGKFAAINFAKDNRISAVIAHLHPNFGAMFSATHKDCIFGVATGTGVDNNAFEASLAFSYGRNYKEKPIVGCSVIAYGEDPQMFRMRL